MRDEYDGLFILSLANGSLSGLDVRAAKVKCDRLPFARLRIKSLSYLTRMRITSFPRIGLGCISRRIRKGQTEIEVSEEVTSTMPTRREFLKSVSGTTAGILFAGCSCGGSSFGFARNPLQSAARPVANRKPREVIVGGRRAAVVDVHAHVRVPEAWDLVKDRIGREGRAGDMTLANPDNPANIRNDVEKHLADLDEMGIDVQALSINPFWYWADEDLSRKIVQIQNEKLAELCAAHPKRFAGLGSLALQHPSMAVEQMEDGVKNLGMRGFAIGGSVNGDDLSAPKFHPFWAKAEELQTLIFIHPQSAGRRLTRRG